MTDTTAESQASDFVFTRRVAARRERVFEAWTNPVHLAKWWGPEVITNTVHEVDARVGGAWHIVMRTPDGTDYPIHGTFLEVTAPERLVLVLDPREHPAAWHAAMNQQRGLSIDAPPTLIHTTVTFEAAGDDTILTVVQRFELPGDAAAFRRMGHDEGSAQGFDRLEALLVRECPGNEILQTRRVAAPRARVFEAWTRPEHVDRWWGPDGFKTTTAAMDVRVGGEWRFMMTSASWGEFPNRVRYLEVVAPERLHYLHDTGIEGDPAGFRVTVTFVALGAETEVRMRTVFPSIEACEAVKKFGAVELGGQTLRHLAEFLAGTD